MNKFSNFFVKQEKQKCGFWELIFTILPVRYSSSCIGSTEDPSSKSDPLLAAIFDRGLRRAVASSISKTVFGGDGVGEGGSLSLRNSPMTEAAPGCSMPP